MRKLLLPVLVLIPLIAGSQQPVGTWSDHLRYNTATAVAAGQKEIFASTGSSLIVYNKEFAELRKLSRINGLTETGISSIAWSEDHSTLIIAYKNTNIDLVVKNNIFNVPDIYRKSMPERKYINRIRIKGRHAFLATSFGVVIVDLLKKEIFDTWRPGPGPEINGVNDVAFGEGNIYAATDNGLWFASLTDQGLSYYANWSLAGKLPSPYARYTMALYCGDRLYANESDNSDGTDRLYSVGEDVSLASYVPGVQYRSIDPLPQGFAVTSRDFVNIHNADGSLRKTIRSYGWGDPDFAQAAGENGNIWLADISFGLVRGDDAGNYTSLSLPGPVTNNISNISSSNGKTILCAGGVDMNWKGLGRPFSYSVIENNTWSGSKAGDFTDAMRSAVDPGDNSHFFISSWGYGLFEYRNNETVNHYDATNSPLQPEDPGNSGIKICGMAFDKSGNLWITQSGNPGKVMILKKGGSWMVYPHIPETPVLSDIIALADGTKWILLPSVPGLFAIDDNDTPGNFTDDRYRMSDIRESDGRVINDVFSMAADLEGNLWIGTDKGPLVSYAPEKIYDDALAFSGLKTARNDGSGLADYMLGSESITSITADGANRKWIGTVSSGAYLLSPDGTILLRNHNKQNSPMYSDSLITIATDNKTGEVWFGTPEGVLSVREIATAGSSGFENVYAFPNPVREDFEGNITITGLVSNTRIKITDVSGNLVYETLSEGGQASWDLTTYQGRKVTTGVYLVFCSDDNGKRSAVTKILVVRK